MSDLQPKGFTCPNCAHEFDMAFVAKMGEQSVLHWRLTPAPGELLDAKTIGDSLTKIRDLLKSFGRDAGVPTEVLVKSATTLEDGTIDIELLVTRFEQAEERRARRAKAKAELVP